MPGYVRVQGNPSGQLNFCEKSAPFFACVAASSSESRPRLRVFFVFSAGPSRNFSESEQLLASCYRVRREQPLATAESYSVRGMAIRSGPVCGYDRERKTPPFRRTKKSRGGTD
eukprot:1793462-Rhodomonas_salina.3